MHGTAEGLHLTVVSSVLVPSVSPPNLSQLIVYGAVPYFILDDITHVSFSTLDFGFATELFTHIIGHRPYELCSDKVLHREMKGMWPRRDLITGWFTCSASRDVLSMFCKPSS